MRDALPHLFEHSPDLLYQLVTLVSPTQLRVRRHAVLTIGKKHVLHCCAVLIDCAKFRM